MTTEAAADHVATGDEVRPSLSLPYDFHDQRFVTWWLGSLYLFPLEEQIVIAQRLTEAIHAPAAKAEVEAFLEYMAPRFEQPEQAADPALVDPPMQQIRERLAVAWKANPWLVSLGLAALLFFTAKGLLFAGKELFRLVF